MRKHIYIIAGLMTGLFGGPDAQARHIIGGNLTYECLGNGDYSLVLSVYRDCNCTECAELDEEAFIGIYRCADGNCPGQSQSNPLVQFSVPLNRQGFVERPDYPCLIPPDICVEEGVYNFRLSDYGIRLPPSDDFSYYITYQRCCRNRTINNIIDPDNVGSTYTVEITPEAQDLCNSSPTFNTFPPTVVCADAPLEYDHSATDPDGDQLVYEFCAPLAGGGPFTQDPTVFTCAGAAPRPGCPPPYTPVSFVSPRYSATQPMGGDPVIQIDPNTGLITGTPDVLGQFVVGVCVSEYRNGVLLSRIYRDFQFNVAPCDAQVQASIQSDSTFGTRAYVLNSCGNETVSFLNQSFEERFIDFQAWQFPLENGDTLRSSEWSPTITFPGVGQYTGTLILNPETDCGDTATISVNVFPETNADFTFAYDTCRPGPVVFEDLSTTDSEGITDWQWQFGDGDLSSEQNPLHRYEAPGNQPVQLLVRDVNNCQSNVTRQLAYFPVPEEIIVAPTTFEGCIPARITFNNLSEPIDETYSITWNFGDGATSNAISPTHIYSAPGIYNIDLEIISPIGCQTDTFFGDWIEVLPSPEAGFSYRPDELNTLSREVFFTDESINAIRWEWEFGEGGDQSMVRDPVHVFPDTGLYNITQVVVHPNGCRDTAQAILDVVPIVLYNLPNAFTPNGDSRNDTFFGKGLIEGMRNFQMTIWNRWGQLVFETSDPYEGWDGRELSSGGEAPNGVYVVQIQYEGPRGGQYQEKGFVTLLR